MPKVGCSQGAGHCRVSARMRGYHKPGGQRSIWWPPQAKRASRHIQAGFPDGCTPGTQGSHQDPPSWEGGQAVWGEASTWLATGQSRTGELEAPRWGTQQQAANLQLVCRYEPRTILHWTKQVLILFLHCSSKCALQYPVWLLQGERHRRQKRKKTS